MAKATRLDDLNPDGIRIVVNWEGMVVGASVFVPCVNTSKLKLQLKNIEQLKGWNLKATPKIENQQFGVRIWRTT